MKKVLVIAPTSREYRELPAIAAALNCELIFEDFAGTYFDNLLSRNHHGSGRDLEILPLIEETITRHRHSGLTGATSGVGYPGTPVCSILADRLGLPGPSIESVLVCDHKYYSRLAQKALAPDAVPWFELVDPANLDDHTGKLKFPLFLKPVKSCFSINADKITDPETLRQKIGSWSMPAGFLKPFDDLIRTHTDFRIDSSFMIAETLLKGSQVSLEGYVFRGQVHVLGIVDAVMYPGTHSFERFEYPSRLSEGVQTRMKRIAETLISGLGYDNAMFNMEFMYDARTDEIHVIEINPKIASQFTDLFEKVDGASSYAPMLQIALGEEPGFPRKRGPFTLAASCVMRSFANQRVLRAPSKDEVRALMKRFPDARVEINVLAGSLLSDVMQDGKSFRYGLINIGANSHEELMVKLEDCKRMLNFQFGDV